MIEQCSQAGILEFDETYIEKVCSSEQTEEQRWAFGRIHDRYEKLGVRILWSWMPVVARTARVPGAYKALPKSCPNVYQETNEYFHSTIRNKYGNG